MNRGKGGWAGHEPSYVHKAQDDDGVFRCIVTCSCGAYEQTAKSKVSHQAARGNARRLFNAHSGKPKEASDSSSARSTSTTAQAGFRAKHGDTVFAVGFGVALVADSVLAGIVTASGEDGAAASVVVFIFLFLLFGLGFALLLGGLAVVMTPPEKRRAEKEAARTTSSSPVRVPLRQWRGLPAMTRAATVEAYCARCRRTWRLEGKRANTIADAQNLGNRMMRGGTKMEQFGATFTPGASGRRIAAGLESERHSRDLGWALSLAACPSCGQVDEVQLRK